ncbi:thiol:disulfide interchange protein TlpA [Geofilum rubicundum JCM 15548]|uniref:Thiol:disulfide interchange protein TlpA n=2 Tax=Geofilum TaxID=1236988 RepID=A0A0E9LTQ5_9BACT|nr:thiol:disulfide interchange protein TlpA [Geofilum rubicundum JCM 15548]
MTLSSYLELTKIELSDSATVLSFLVNFRPHNWISIPKETYIQNPVDEEKLFVVGTEGIPFNEKYWMPDSGQVAYKLIFPPVDKDWERLDYGEDISEGSSWAIFDVQLKPNEVSSLVPTEFKGNWFNVSNAYWELGLLDTLAIYKNQIWKYKAGDFSNNKGQLTLTGREGEVRLYLRNEENGQMLAGEDPENLRTYVTNDVLSSMTIPMDSSVYTPPVFHSDSVTFSGFIAGYSPRVGFKTFTLYVNDILTGEQSSKTIRISESGEFSITFPYYYPHSAFLRSPFAGGSLFLEPGKDLFVMYDGQDIFYMGELGKLNKDLQDLREIVLFNYRHMQAVILNMTPLDYKAFINEQYEESLLKLNEFEKTHGLQPKVRQIKELDLRYRRAENLLSYQMNFDQAYRQKHEVPRSQRELPIEIESPDHEYYDFLTTDFANNPLAVVADSYNSFVNRLMYSDLLRDNQSLSLSTMDIVERLLESGQKLAPEEVQMMERLKAYETSEGKMAIDAFNKKHMDLINGFVSKYSEDLKDLFENNRRLNVTITMMADHLKIKDVEITDEEQELVDAVTAFNQSPPVIEAQVFQKENGEATSQFHKNHRDFVNKIFAEARKDSRNRLLKDSVGIESGLMVDVMNAQDFLRPVASQMVPAAEEELEVFQKETSTPFIAAYAEVVNDRSLAKIEANKTKSGYTKNEVPKSEADQIFEAMMAKFKGKVAYVDFWASWCGPCRSGIERVKSLKEELKDEEVVFVYITNQSTPEKTWENMIPDIKGEHFRVSTDEWNFLSEKFNISGIPHYVLVDKTGHVVEPKMGYHANEALKNKLLEHINK